MTHYKNKDITIQLEQKLIHYRSELAIYNQKLLERERELQKEIVRNEYLQKKLYDMDHFNHHSYEKEIKQLNKTILTLEVELEEEKKRSMLLHDLNNQQGGNLVAATSKHAEETFQLQAFFNYSILLSDFNIEDQEVVIFGNFTILNTGTSPLHDMIICIKLKPSYAGYLSGKIATLPVSKQENTHFEEAEQWRFAHDNWKEKIRETGEYWLKPTVKQEIQPNEQVIFPGFEITLNKPADSHSFIVEGFAYCREISKGIPSINHIIINF